MERGQGEGRVFTLHQAQGLLPKLRRLLARVTAEREALLDMRMEIDRAREKSEIDGGSLEGSAYLRHMISFTEGVREIEATGVLVKDFHTGLVDFPYVMQDRIVYLCWKPEESDINWWHEVEAGFAGRQPLTDDFT